MKITIILSRNCKITEVINNDLGIRTGFIFEGDDIEVSDEYHSMDELYMHRMMLNAALFNREGVEAEFCEVIKSKFHHDGTMFDGYFIVMMVTPHGQISYHYKLKYWNLFHIPERDRAPEWDGHNSIDVLKRLGEL